MIGKSSAVHVNVTFSAYHACAGCTRQALPTSNFVQHSNRSAKLSARLVSPEPAGISQWSIYVSEPLHPAAPHHLPGFITAPGDTDVLMIVVGIVLIGAIVGVGNLYLHLHTLPERMAHKSQKLQFEIVAVLGLLALFTHNHLFWVIGLFLAMVDLPDFGTPLRRIAGSVEKMAGVPPEPDPTLPPRTPQPRGRQQTRRRPRRQERGAGSCLRSSSARS